MKEPRSAATAAKYFYRALRLRCPACGKKPMFLPWHSVRTLRDWFTPLDGCPRCGYPYEREPGYFLMSIWAINYGAGSVFGLILYGLLEWFFHLPVGWLLFAVLAPVGLFTLLFARHSKSFFLACDLFFDPHERGGGNDGGNTPPPPPGLDGGPAAQKRVEPCERTGAVR